jgi:uncharacterized protein
MGTQNRGFASMTEEDRKKIASSGGRAAQATGNAHRWTTEDARAAGRKGGLARKKTPGVAPTEIMDPAVPTYTDYETDNQQ